MFTLFLLCILFNFALSEQLTVSFKAVGFTGKTVEATIKVTKNFFEIIKITDGTKLVQGKTYKIIKAEMEDEQASRIQILVINTDESLKKVKVYLNHKKMGGLKLVRLMCRHRREILCHASYINDFLTFEAKAFSVFVGKAGALNKPVEMSLLDNLKVVMVKYAGKNNFHKYFCPSDEAKILKINEPRVSNSGRKIFFNVDLKTKSGEEIDIDIYLSNNKGEQFPGTTKFVKRMYRRHPELFSKDWTHPYKTLFGINVTKTSSAEPIKRTRSRTRTCRLNRSSAPAKF